MIKIITIFILSAILSLKLVRKISFRESYQEQRLSTQHRNRNRGRAPLPSTCPKLPEGTVQELGSSKQKKGTLMSMGLSRARLLFLHFDDLLVSPMK